MIYNQAGITKNRNLSEFVVIKNIKQRLQELFNDKEYISMKNYLQHGTTDCILHSISVTHYSVMFAHRMHIKVNYKNLIIGALLHDYFLYDWHEKSTSHKWHGFKHPKFALNNASRKWDLTDMEKDIIKCHMFPLTIFSVPRYKESIIVCLVDKMCATYEIFAKKDPYKRIKKLYKL